MNLERIKQVAEKKGISIRKLAEVIEKTEQGLHSAIRNNTLKSIDLEKIAEVLQVPVSYFFEDGENPEISKKIIQNGSINNVGGQNNNNNANDAKLQACERENELLKQQIVDKERIIRMLEREKD